MLRLEEMGYPQGEGVKGDVDKTFIFNRYFSSMTIYVINE